MIWNLVSTTPWLVWPGAYRCWQRGDTTSMVIAVLTGQALMLAVLSTWVWPEWLSAWLRFGLWTALLVVGSVGLLTGYWTQVPRARMSSQEAESILIQAQEAYLQSDYFEAERLVNQLSNRNQVDIEASLLLVSIFKRSGRYDAALESIAHLELLEGSAPWMRELAHEKADCLRRKVQRPPAQGA